MTREEFFSKLNAGAKWDVGVSIARTNPLPLDANEIFESISDMETYIKSNALAYPGQIVVVLGESETAAYLVKTVGGDGKGYTKLAATSGSGDVGEQLETLGNRLTTVEGYFTNGIAKSAIQASQDIEGNVISDTYATKDELTTAITGSVQYLDTVATDTAVSALKPNSKGDFARASANFTLSAANSSTGEAISVHAGDLLICASIESPNTWTISHGGEEGVVSISNGTGIAINNTNPASPTISLTTDYVDKIATIVDKVDKVDGKGLSTNDFTTEEKTKLAGLTKITVADTLTAIETNPVQGKVIYETIHTLEQKVDGKLDVIAVDDTLSGTSTNPVQNKAIFDNFGLFEDSIKSLNNHFDTVDGDIENLKSAKVSSSTTNGYIKIGDADTKVYELPTASATNLGGIKIGDRLSIDATTGKLSGPTLNDLDGITPTAVDSKISTAIGLLAFDSVVLNDGETISSISQTSGKITVTKQAIGIQPDQVGGLSNFMNTTETSLDKLNKIKVTSTSVTDGTNTFSKFVLSKASTDTLGGIKTGYNGTTEKTYAVQIDDNGNAYVAVNWVDTNTFRTIQIDTAQTDSIAPLNLKSGTNISLALDHGVDSENVTINHTGPGSASQTTTGTKADSSLVEDGGTVAFGKEFYVPSFGIDANGHTRDLKMTKYSLPTPETYSLQIATTNILGGIKSGNKANNFVAGSAGEGQTGNVPNYEAEVVVNSTTGKATVNLEAMAGPETQWSIEAGQTVFGIRQVSTDKLVQGTNILIINGGGANW